MSALNDNETICQILYHLSSSYSESHSFTTSVEGLNKISADLARDTNTRSSPSIWKKLFALWESLSDADVSTLDAETRRDLTLSIARFTRNLLPANTYNQNQTFKCERSIRQVTHEYTSFASTQDPASFIVTRLLMQTLSNLVTSNEALIQELWTVYMSLPDESNILLRVLAHPDDRAVLAALVFISNCINGNPERMSVLISTPAGKRLCVALFDILAKQVEAEDESDGAEVFDVGWNVFKLLFDNRLAPNLFSAVTISDEIATPHQTTLLKIVDTYLVQLSESVQGAVLTAADPDIEHYHAKISQFTPLLAFKFLELSQYAQLSIQQSLGAVSTATVSLGSSNGPSGANLSPEDVLTPLQNLDMLLPKVCEAIVLVTQCLCTMTLMEAEASVLAQNGLNTKAFLIEARTPQGRGLVEDLIDLLRCLDAFLPRIVFGKAAWSTPRSGVPAPAPSPTQSQVDVTGFNYLKRDLVRLLGILCYGSRAVQDRIRACNGIPVVMNLCAIDERNPYLREHALFALRNLLYGNVENQAIVDAIKPMGQWDENGILQDSPGTRK